MTNSTSQSAVSARPAPENVAFRVDDCGVEPNYGLYSFEKQKWADQNPNATPEEYQRAIRSIAKRCGV